VRAFRTRASANEPWFYFGQDSLGQLRHVISSLLPLQLRFALQPNQIPPTEAQAEEYDRLTRQWGQPLAPPFWQ